MYRVTADPDMKTLRQLKAVCDAYLVTETARQYLVLDEITMEDARELARVKLDRLLKEA